jgi:hypothetical protein
MFNFPKCSPNWFIRLESNLPSIEFDYSKHLLFFYNRLLHKPKDSLVWSCLSVLKKHSSNSAMKTNWYRSFSKLSSDWGLQEILAMEEINNEALSYANNRITVMRLVGKIKLQMQQLDINNMLNSNSMPFYKNIRCYLRTEDFMMLHTNWSSIVTIIQLRSKLSKIKCTNLPALAFSYKQCDTNICQKCSMNEVENCFHVLFRCPKYSLLRNHFLRNYFLPQVRGDYYDFFCELNLEKNKCIDNYVKCMIDIRNSL